MQHNQAIFESLFNRNFSDTGNTGFLRELAEKHPYFSPAQFFLLEKTQNDNAFEKQAVKTNILFNNPHWLYFQLTQTRNIEEEVITEEKTPEPETEIANVETAVIENTAIDVVEQEKAAEEIISEPETNTMEAEPVVIETTQVETPQFINAEQSDEPDDTDKPELVENEGQPVNIKLKMPEQKTNLDEAMLFEPMHMVDYFASQGIKLSDEVQLGDKLGKQLKSFTEWLKTMKKVHVENEAENPVKNDANVQILAEKSNAKAEVLTEAMAEVFASQGKMAKAAEVYEKLSLLNPAKSIYFAAKLENLKAL